MSERSSELTSCGLPTNLLNKQIRVKTSEWDMIGKTQSSEYTHHGCMITVTIGGMKTNSPEQIKYGLVN